MYDYGKLVYLDNQKTGSTFVSQFLAECCTLKNLKSRKHYAVKRDYRPRTVYFSTVRHPVDLYVSLFQYGHERRGGTFKKLSKIKRLDLYDNLPVWLDFVLDPANGDLFHAGFKQLAPLGVGLMTYRAMHITLRHATDADPQELRTTFAGFLRGLFKPAPAPAPRPVTMQNAKSYPDLIRMWDKNNIASHVFRQENLNDSLLTFATETVPQFFDQDAVRRFLTTSERINSSGPRAAIEIPEVLYQRIIVKERFLMKRFYSDRTHASQIIRT